jgi:iron complex transport system permease protein
MNEAAANSPVQSTAATPFRSASAVLFYVAGAVAVAAGMLVALRIGSGAIEIGWSEIFAWIGGREIDELHANVLANIRMPRIILAVATGGVLSLAGIVYQAILRNPLADPYTLGVSGGATLAAVSAVAFVPASGAVMTSTSALAGAALAILLIYAIGRLWGGFSTSALILAGVALNMVFASLILFIQYFSDFTQIYEMIRWMMGGLDIVGYGDFALMAPVAAGGFAMIALAARELDLLAVDPVTAASLGVRVTAVRWRMLLAASLMTGCVVALAGPIGFVGLIVPHCVRMVLGAGHARVIPVSIAVGALFLLACDTLAQNILGDEELPVGIITSVFGGPFFIYLLLRRRKNAPIWAD